MRLLNHLPRKGIFIIAILLPALRSLAQTATKPDHFFHPAFGTLGMLLLLVSIMLLAVLYLKSKANQYISTNTHKKDPKEDEQFSNYIRNLNSEQIDAILTYNRRKKQGNPGGNSDSKNRLLPIFLLLPASLFSVSLLAQGDQNSSASPFTQTGIIITITLLVIPVLAGIILMIAKVSRLLRNSRERRKMEEADRLANYLSNLPDQESLFKLEKRKQALEFRLSNNELSGNLPAEDEKGIINNAGRASALTFVAIKKKAVKRPNIDPELSKLILWYIGTATFWLLFGTTVGEYLGIKFVAPDADHISWLSFGRLRPVHTNAVFWGWASLAMLGLGYYVVAKVSNVKMVGIKRGWWALILINAAVVLGSICLMAGINNGGGEYREYIWPVMLLFGIGLVLTLINFIQTIARRETKEIYISNWYIVSAIIFALVISIVAYVPSWQDGLGETIVQGYYMHQGVGMWFMLFTLGIVYYFLPQQLNQPIYSYSLGILAFWTQILFYTLIGSHHFVFSSIPWWLQTVAIVGSMGMVIPVVAGTTNFIMTFRGSWYNVPGSYTLPFFLVGVIFYFTGSMQGTAEAFRSTNLIWHFTDFTVAHSHLTMYGIISFLVWAGIYALIPRLTGKEPPQITVGAHFWLALIGLLFYTVPLMYGSTLKGIMWKEGKPFIDGVVFMAPYWLWRAIGGTLMWTSHLFFAYNLYKMLAGKDDIDVKEIAIKKIQGNLDPLKPIA